MKLVKIEWNTGRIERYGFSSRNNALDFMERIYDSFQNQSQEQAIAYWANPAFLMFKFNVDVWHNSARLMEEKESAPRLENPTNIFRHIAEKFNGIPI